MNFINLLRCSMLSVKQINSLSKYSLHAHCIWYSYIIKVLILGNLIVQCCMTMQVCSFEPGSRYYTF